MSRTHFNKRKKNFSAPGYARHYYNDSSEIQALKRAKAQHGNGKKFIEHKSVLLVWCGGKFVHWEMADPKLIGKD